MATYKSYLERFNKSKTSKRDVSADAKLSTEKETYVQFLEVQLERISSALVQIDAYNEKLETTNHQVSDMDDKISNMNKLVKLLQSFSEGQVRIIESIVPSDVYKNLLVYRYHFYRKYKFQNSKHIQFQSSDSRIYTHTHSLSIYPSCRRKCNSI